MSAISSVGNSNSALYLAAQADAANSTDDPSVDASSATPAADAIANSTATISPLADFRNQIETAVTNAVNQLPAGSSPQDIFNTIRSAVEDTFKANGLDSGQLTGHRGGGHANGVSGGAGASSGSDPDGDGDTNQQSATDPLLTLGGGTSSNAAGTPSRTSLLALYATSSNSTDALASLMQQLSGGTQSGQTGSQSGQPSSLFDALQNSTGSGLDLSSVFQQLFQGFPNGTGLDVQM